MILTFRTEVNGPAPRTCNSTRVDTSASSRIRKFSQNSCYWRNSVNLRPGSAPDVVRFLIRSCLMETAVSLA